MNEWPKVADMVSKAYQMQRSRVITVSWVSNLLC